jgi:hypothetical protein
VAAHNFQIIGQYRTIGIDAFKEHNEWLSQLFKRATPNNRCKMRLQYFACSFICIFASTLMLFIPAFESSFQADLFLTFFVAGLVFGIGGFLFGIGIAN